MEKSDVPTKIVIVDNTPGDPGLAQVLESHPDVTLLLSKKNGGFGSGCNIGMEWALNNTACEFVLLLNPDTVVREDAISLLEGTMDERPRAGVATGRIVFMENPDVLFSGRGRIDWRRGGARVPEFGGSALAQWALQAGEIGFASGCVMMIRRAVLESIGGFDPVFFMYEEDVDLSIRVRKAGFTIFYCPEALILHKGQGTQRSGGAFQKRWSPANENYDFQVFYSVRNAIINARKHARGKDLVLFAAVYPLFVMRRTIPAAWRLGFRAFRPVWRGVATGIREPLQQATRLPKADLGRVS